LFTEELHSVRVAMNCWLRPPMMRR
jgi:hypothetical protein